MALIRTANSERPWSSSEGKTNDSTEQTNDDVNKRIKVTHGDPKDIRVELLYNCSVRRSFGEARFSFHDRKKEERSSI